MVVFLTLSALRVYVFCRSISVNLNRAKMGCTATKLETRVGEIGPPELGELREKQGQQPSPTTTDSTKDSAAYYLLPQEIIFSTISAWGVLTQSIPSSVSSSSIIIA